MYTIPFVEALLNVVRMLVTRTVLGNVLDVVFVQTVVRNLRFRKRECGEQGRKSKPQKTGLGLSQGSRNYMTKLAR